MSRFSLRGLLAWGPPLAAMAAIFLFSSRDAPDILKHQIFDAQDKAIHAFVYFILAALYLRALLYSGFRLTLGTLALAAALSSLYGMTDEWHQAYVPTRQSDIGDWVADTVGAGLILFTQKLWPRLSAWEERVWQRMGWSSAKADNADEPV